jgi:hypothetical protein
VKIAVAKSFFIMSSAFPNRELVKTPRANAIIALLDNRLPNALRTKQALDVSKVGASIDAGTFCGASNGKGSSQ